MNSGRRRWIARAQAAAGVVATAVLLAACGGGATGGSARTGGDESDLVQPAGAPAAPTSTLRVAVDQEIPNLDPPRSSPFAGPMIHAAYDTLTSIGPDGAAAPWLATGWTQPDPLTWQFALRDDVTFHDGSAFDAETVKLNLERNKGITGSPWSYVYDPITEVTVLDPRTVRISFSTPQPGFPESMGQIAGAMVSPKAITEGVDLTRAEAGSGGWRWAPNEHIEGSKHVFHANPDYWNPDAVKVETIEVHVIEDAMARVNAVQSGQVDIGKPLSPDLYSAAEGAGLVVINKLPATGTLVIFDREGAMVPAFAEPEVRQAMAMLIDRQAYSTAVLAGKGDPSNGFGAPGTWWRNEEIADAQPFDVEKAKELLAAAGYPDGFSFDAPTNPATKNQNEAIAQMLAKGGITMNLVGTADGQYTADIRKGRFAAGYLVPSATDPYTWWSRSISNNSPYNPFGLTDMADLEAKYVEATGAADQATRKRLLDEIQAEVIERGIVVTTGFTATGVVLAPSIRFTQVPVFSPNEHMPRPFYVWKADH